MNLFWLMISTPFGFLSWKLEGFVSFTNSFVFRLFLDYVSFHLVIFIKDDSLVSSVVNGPKEWSLVVSKIDATILVPVRIFVVVVMVVHVNVLVDLFMRGIDVLSKPHFCRPLLRVLRLLGRRWLTEMMRLLGLGILLLILRLVI